MEPAHLVWKAHPFLLKFTEDFGIRYYGLAYVLGFVIAWALLRAYWRHGRSPLAPEAQSDLFFAIVLGTLVGGRLGFFLFYDLGAIMREPWVVFLVWRGGMASHGGFIGVILGLWWASWRNRLPVFSVGDIVSTLAPPGLMLGRIANFINGELWGRPTEVPWAVMFETYGPDGRLISQTEPRHPSQLYEAALEGLALLLYTQWRIWRTPKVLGRPGQLAGEFLLGYAAARVFSEFFRQHDPGIEPVLGLNRGAWLSLLLAIGGIMLIWRARARQPVARSP